MHNKVVYRIARGLRRAGAVVLRFNYRGVNLSEGEYAHGEGETADARVALAYLRERYPELPFTLAGFSFGSRIALRLACEEPECAKPEGEDAETNPPSTKARRVIAVGFPTVYRDRSYLDGCTVPRVFVQSTYDEFGPVVDLRAIVDALPEPRKMLMVEAQDHFFAGALEQLENEIAALDSI